MAIRRIAYPDARGALNCLKCKTPMALRAGKRKTIRCTKCGTDHIISYTSGGFLMLTDKEHAHQFK